MIAARCHRLLRASAAHLSFIHACPVNNLTPRGKSRAAAAMTTQPGAGKPRRKGPTEGISTDAVQAHRQRNDTASKANRRYQLADSPPTESAGPEEPSTAEPSPEELAARRRYMLFIEYRGDKFSGSQRQPEGIPTVQAAIEDALEEITKEPTTLYMSSRTDAGVHALASSGHINLIRRHRYTGAIHPDPFSPELLQTSINYQMRRDGHACRVTRVEVVAPTVDARTDATLRTYVYRITCPSDESRVSTFDWNHVWPYPGLLDVAAMQAAAEHLLGKHDFSSFRAAGCTARTPVRNVQRLSVEEQPAAPSWAPQSANSSLGRTGACSVVITLQARAFLYHQCRLMVGWLVACGSGERNPADTPAVLASRSVAALGGLKMAPPWGLYLAEVHYDRALLLPSPDWVPKAARMPQVQGAAEPSSATPNSASPNSASDTLSAAAEVSAQTAAGFAGAVSIETASATESASDTLSAAAESPAQTAAGFAGAEAVETASAVRAILCAESLVPCELRAAREAVDASNSAAPSSDLESVGMSNCLPAIAAV